MKAAQLILQHLIEAKQVTLQDLGTFYLSPDMQISESDKEPVIPEGALSFTANPRAGMDENLIAFIMQQTRKIRPLATSDLESYLHLGKQFLNLGKPFVIEGLGYLQKSGTGEVIFTPTFSSLAKTEMLPPEPREKGNEEISFASQPKKKNKWKSLFPLILIIVFLTGSVLYYFLGRKQDKTIEVVIPSGQDSGSVAINPGIKPDSLATGLSTGNTFLVVLKQYPDSLSAETFFNLIRNSHPGLLVYKYDSARYNVAVKCVMPLSDTLRARDSLARLVGLDAWIDAASR